MFLLTWAQGPKSLKTLSFRTHVAFSKPVPLCSMGCKRTAVARAHICHDKNSLFIALSDKAPLVTRHPIQRSDFCRHLYAKLKKSL